MITAELRAKAEDMMRTEVISQPEWRALVHDLLKQGTRSADYGLPASQEPKYDISPDNGKIFNRESGRVIPDDEPIMIFRARDVNAAPTILQYAYKCVNPQHHKIVMERCRQFEQFALQHAELTKEPD